MYPYAEYLQDYIVKLNGYSKIGKPANDFRLPIWGKFFRKYWIDEIPQLLNVIKGDMSLVGPRPLAVKYLSLYNEEQKRRHLVRPGITGWAQVNGRNAMGWDEKFKLDVWYVDHRSLWLDLKILAITIWQVIRRQGISHPGSATMPEFQGHRPAEDR